jgi:hypothetical protein
LLKKKVTNPYPVITVARYIVPWYPRLYVATPSMSAPVIAEMLRKDCHSPALVPSPRCVP